MMKGLVKVESMDLNLENYICILHNNSKLRDDLFNILLDIKVDEINDEFLSNIPSVTFNLGSIYEKWYDISKVVMVNVVREISIANINHVWDVIDNSFDTDDENIDSIIQKMNLYCVKALNHPYWSDRYERLSDRALLHIEKFLDKLQTHFEIMLDEIDDIEYLAEYLNDSDYLDDYYINPDTFEIFKHM